MTMVRVEYKLKGGSPQVVRGWDLRLENELMVMNQSVKEGDKCTVVPMTLGSMTSFSSFAVHPCSGSPAEHLAIMDTWKIGDEELEALME